MTTAVYKTKEAAAALNVSPTTIKRWASHFQDRFRKDHWGHYYFSEPDLQELAYIQKELDRGASLNRIELNDRRVNREEASPAPAPTIVSEEVLEAAGSGLSELLMTTTVQLNGRLDAMEHKLAEKAGTVVSVQLLQHRKELDELRSSLHQLSQYVEAIDKSLSHLQKLAEPAPVAAAYAGPPRTEKRKTLLASLLHL